ncbi:MAG: hypothetical protein WA989_11425 [Henriciella sp.]|uniref:hypothetical protein n=1 Tax=Henriciella sp. TaxID=1968823 RepID=UPI003C70B02B
MTGKGCAALKGPALARRLEPWVALQLGFAARCAAIGGLSPAEAITQYTAIYKRMGFGPNARGPLHPDWLALCAPLNEAADIEAQLAILMPELDARIVGYRHYSDRLFGCFSFDAPNEAGAVKLHFIPDHSDAPTGPLHKSHRGARRAELAAMFAFIRRHHGERAKSVRGLSWLYHTGAYCALFPPAFSESARPDADAGAKPQGMRYWGQFLTHRGHLRHEVATAFRDGFDTLILERLAETFPYRPLLASAPIDVFYDAFDSPAPAQT